MSETCNPLTLHRESYVMYESFAKVLNKLDNNECGILVKAMNHYAIDGEVNQTFDNPILEAFWTLIEPQLRANKIKAFNGSKGGKAKGVNYKKYQSFSESAANVKVKEKTNEKAKKEDTNVSRAPTIQTLKPEQAEKFDKFNSWLKEKCPFVAKMSKQLTFSQMEKLMTKYGKDKVFEILRNMDNWKKGGKTVDGNHTDVYQTANNWLKRDKEKEGDIQ